ncbi:MAG: hypothetical protein V7607_5656 [Solirubrobacteraceae bacterium]
MRTKPWTFGPTLSTDEFGDLERQYVLRVLDKRRVFRFADEEAESSEALALEALYRERLGVAQCLALNAGTSALICALIAAGIGPGDEVIVPAYTYVATAAAVVIARAVPVIVEVDDTLTIDPRALAAAITPYTKAVIPVHMRGVPCQMDELMPIARSHGLRVIEDNAQANGGSYDGRALGSIGDAGCFSFQQYKLITAGEGGMLATSDDEIHARAQAYHDCAFSYWDLNKATRHDLLPGENYRMSEINAALALAQSQRLESLVARLRRVKRSIVEGIEDLEQIQLQRIPDPSGDVSYSLVFYLPTAQEADEFADLLTAEGIPAATMGTHAQGGIPDRHVYRNWSFVLAKRGVSDKDSPWTHPSYHGDVEYAPDMCPQSLDWLGRSVSIGLHQGMAEEDCDDIVQAVHKVCARVS